MVSSTEQGEAQFEADVVQLYVPPRRVGMLTRCPSPAIYWWRSFRASAVRELMPLLCVTALDGRPLRVRAPAAGSRLPPPDQLLSLNADYTLLARHAIIGVAQSSNR